VDHPLENVLNGGHSWYPWAYTHVESAPFVDLQPVNPPLTVHLSQLELAPGNDHQYEHTALSPPSLLSSLCSDAHSLIGTSGTPVVPPDGGQSPLSSDPPFDISPAYACSDDMVEEIKGHTVLRYPEGSYRCLSVVTASGKVSQYTRRSERAPSVGQPCGQTFRGQDELVRHLKTSRWHRELGEKHQPLSCDVCGKQLSRRDALTRHMRAVHLSTSFILHRLVNRILTSLSTEPKAVPKSTAAHSKLRTTNNKSVKRILKGNL
jgi:uncharacterized Zn-finger protein